MSKKRAFIFPGQGTQKVGMAKDFYDRFSVAKETFQEADDILSRALSKIIFGGPAEELTRTDHCQVAIYVASMAILRVVEQQFPDLKPCVCAGLSLGEYTALTAAGKITYRDCLPLVEARGQYMHAACHAHPGAMIVVMGKTQNEVQELLDAMGPNRSIWIANMNCPGQIVLAGTKAGAEAAQAFFRVLPLDVAGAFHSPLMQEAKERLAPMIESITLAQSEVPVVMNAKGEVPESLLSMRAMMIEQVIAPVYWEKGVHAMEEMGTVQYIEMGPGKTLSGMNRRIGTAGESYNVETIEDLERLGEVVHGSVT